MIVAVIPTRFHPPTLEPLLAQFEAEDIPVLLFESAEYNNELHVMWNEGVRQARGLGATEIAILNDDIELPVGGLAMMAQALREAPKAAVVFPDLHVAKPNLPGRCRWAAIEQDSVGHCFMFKAELDVPRFPEAYHIWHGDLIFFEQVRAAGWDCITVFSLRVAHIKSFSVRQIMGTAELLEDNIRRRADRPAPTDWTGRRQSRKMYLEDQRRLAKLQAGGTP